MMKIINSIQNGIRLGIEQAKEVKEADIELSSIHQYDYTAEDSGRFYRADNLSLMKKLINDGFSGKIKTIYIDPPFFSKTKYNAGLNIEYKSEKRLIKYKAYEDGIDDSLESYISFMAARLILMRELLSDDGTIWVHIDWHSSHYIRLLLDEIFGDKRFINEIIWKYKSGGSSKKRFSRKHDSIFIYSKTDRYKLSIPKEKSYNRNLKPYKFKGVKEYEDDYGWYTLVNMKDVWSIDMVGRTSKERNGYATQKPLELLERIIEVSSDEGDLCADFFCGSGSFLEASDKLNRKWIGCDNEKLALSISRKRMGDNLSNFRFYKKTGEGGEVGKLEFSHKGINISENDKKLMVCKLTKFIPNINMENVSPKDKDLIETIIRYEPFSLVNYIMVDNDYSGDFRPEIVIGKADEDIKFFSKGNIKFILVDIFGNEYEYEIN